MLTSLGTGLTLMSDGVGDGGSPADMERVVLRDGSSVVIRLLAVGDEAAIASWFASWFAGLGAETLYARLFVLLEWLDRRTESELGRVDRVDREAVAAFAPDGVTVGIARCLRVGEPGSAEVTVAMADDWRGRGIASMLLERVAARARSLGIEQLTAICLACNHTLIRLLSRLGPSTVAPSDAGLVDVRIDLSSARPDRLSPVPSAARRPAFAALGRL
jgi:RimJ/RimL family protein N-acetyltransferase